MEICNRATIDNAAKEHRIIKPAANVKESIATLPVEAIGIKGGPKFPAPTVPDVSGDLNFLMSTWATQKYQKIFQKLQRIKKTTRTTSHHQYIAVPSTPIVTSGTRLMSRRRKQELVMLKLK